MKGSLGRALRTESQPCWSQCFVQRLEREMGLRAGALSASALGRELLVQPQQSACRMWYTRSMQLGRFLCRDVGTSAGHIGGRPLAAVRFPLCF